MADSKRAKASKNWAQVLLEEDLTTEEGNDILNAFGKSELHMDYAHSIALGYNKERYYLLFVVGGRNFMWASATTMWKEPEKLVLEFFAVTGLEIGQLQTDNKITASSTFKVFCKKQDITLMP
eukprot:2363279-Rhodomonas_salina.1